MTKKRRMFDIDLPDDLPDEATPAPETKSMGGPRPGTRPDSRRGPMATAIGETAEALHRRSAQEAAIRAENDDLAHEFVRLKKLGLITDLIPLDAIRSAKLIRDRARHVDADLGDLKASILALGLSNPIRIEQVGEGVYELVQGWRRLNAYRELLAETGDSRFALIPAGLMARGQTIDGLYRRMVDENMVRKDISWAEMARLALNYAADPGIDCDDLDQAVNVLFATASPQKRSYIRRFAMLLRMMDKVLEHPEAIPRALGLEVAHRLEAEPGSAGVLAQALRALPQRSAEQELATLRDFAAALPPISPAISPRGNQGADRKAPDPKGRGRPAGRAKTVLRVALTRGEVICTASAGKVEMRLDRAASTASFASLDFTSIGQDRLEQAIAAFFTALD